MSGKCFAVLLAAAMAFSLTACTPEEPSVNASDPTQAGTNPPAATMPMDPSEMLTERDEDGS